jgi:tetratricopeptide (TPR) repeat protein
MTFKYNPGFSSDEDLISAFVVREKELQQILQTLQENTGRTYQHLLLVGARGTGKTMLVRRVAAEVRRSEPLNQHWYPLVFGEESYRILSAGEFWLEAIYHLAAQNPGAQWQGVYEELRGEKDEKRLQQRSIAKLMDFADEQGKQILLIVENLNMLFDEQMSDGDDWDLRHTLQNEPRLMLLGTATQRFDQIDNVGNALFEFFALHILEHLNNNECRKLWKSVTTDDLSENQIKPLKILTGGNPRLIKILADFAEGMSFYSLMTNLTQLTDEHTSFFKSLLETLPPTERKVFIALLEKWSPTSAKDIADASRLEVSKVSSLLQRLVGRGAVEVLDKKKKYYQVTDRLFSIYYLMRQTNEQSSQVKVIVEFMVAFYDEDMLAESILSLAKEACDLPDGKLQVNSLAVDAALLAIKDNNLKNTVLKSIPEKFFTEKNLAESVGHYSYAELRKCIHYRAMYRFEILEAVLQKTLEECPNSNAFGWVSLGALLHSSSDRIEDTEKAYQKAIEIDPKFALAWVQLGAFKYEKFQDYKSAESCFLKAIEINSKYEWAWTNLGRIIGNGYYSEKIGNFINQIITSDANNVWAKTLLGMLLLEMYNNFSEAENNFREAINIDSTFVFAWGQLIRLHHKRGNILGQWEKELLTAKETINKVSDKSIWLYPDIIDFIIDASSVGYADQSLKILTESTAATKLQPLIVGLRIFLGEERPLVAQEIFEIGKDVADRIRTKQAELANRSSTPLTPR